MEKHAFLSLLRMKRLWVVLLSVAVLSVVSACGGTSPSSSNSSTSSSKSSTSNMPLSSGSTTKVMIMEVQAGTGDTYSFSPASISIKAGTPVEWTNMTDETQFLVNAMQMPGALPDSSKVEKNGTLRVVFATPGTFDYYSQKHPGAKGTITVTS